MSDAPNKFLKEAERLYRLGFAILWLKPKSKAPIKSKWTTGPRETLEDLKEYYGKGFNMGVRLGTPSKIGDKFLAVIDIDVKSTKAIHQREAEKALVELFPDLPYETVQVMSGRGNGSSHIYVVTSQPLVPHKLKTSKEKIKVKMPSAPISAAQRELLSEEDLNEGYRMRPAWEIAVMGEGQQVVLPPSIHPDSRKEYLWKTVINSGKDLFELKIDVKNFKKETRSVVNDFKPVSVKVGPELEKLLTGEYEDRSAGLFKIAIFMVREGYTNTEIMSLLTDQSFDMGKVAFDHAKTESRSRAADWIFNYTIKKARKEYDANSQFTEEVEIIELSEAETAAQEAELKKHQDWRHKIERMKKQEGEAVARPKGLLRNIVLILTHESSPDVIIRDTFSFREYYTCDTPWGGKSGQALSDDDAIKIRMWLSERYRFEPTKDLIYDALTYLAEKNGFDPVRDWLENLPEWDGVNRLDTWLKENFEAKGDPEYLAQVLRKWVVAIVMRAYRPGSKFDWMPIFEGPQGIGKSSFGRMLVGDKYFVDWLPDLSNKDSALALQGSWAVEMGELANLRKNDVETVKAFVTRTIDKVRPPYGKRWIESPRRCVFFGTTNADAYLRDSSGNRRFKPVKVGQLNFNALKLDRDQLFAEAVFIFRNYLETEATLDIEGTAKIYEAQIQSEKMMIDEVDYMRETFLDFMKSELEKSESEGPKFDFKKFKLKDLFGDYGPFPGKRGEGRELIAVSRVLKSLGGESRTLKGYKIWSLDLKG